MSKAKTTVYKTAEAFGADLELDDIEMAIIREKKKLIEKLKTKRKRKQLSQAALAKLAGSKQPAIARMESGQVSEVSLDFLAKIALILEVSFTIKHKVA